MDANAVLSRLERPFPGLRPFETEESIFFFGREAQTAELLRRLSESRFLAVTGDSGCGKSSLVYAGLLPALHRGYLVNATTRWRVATLRPGNDPISALAAALAKKGALDALDQEKLRSLLKNGSGGLADAVRQAGFASGESLLVVADQFEELFRFATENPAGDSGRSLFVSLLLRAAESTAPIFVAITMRSEYQGACARFPGLPEALNRGQYLVPRMTREQCRQALVRPLDLVGAAITPRLVNQMLNDVGNDPDQLPVLQHAMLRTYQYWKGKIGVGPIDLPAYRAKEVGGVAKALAIHGKSILDKFPNDQKLTEKILRCLTKPEGRRPKKLGTIYEIVDAKDQPAKDRVDKIIEAFARREDSLLLTSSPTLAADTVVDITHESLIRKWPVLAKWAREEAKSAQWYVELARDVLRRREGEAGLWKDPELSLVLDRSRQEGWNRDWALQYAHPPASPSFDEVQRFLTASASAARTTRRRWIFLVLLLTALAGALGTLSLVVWQSRQQLQAARDEAKARVREKEEQLEVLLSAPSKGPEQNRQIEELKRAILDEQSKAQDLQTELDKRGLTPTPVISNDPELRETIQTLEVQLKESEDRWKEAQRQADIFRSRAGTLQNQVTALEAKLAEPEKPADQPQRAGISLNLLTLSKNTIKYVSLGSSTIAVGVGDIAQVDPRAELRLYVWKANLPKELERKRDLVRYYFGLVKGACTEQLELTSASSGCLQVQKSRVASGQQKPATLSLDAGKYEIRVAYWPDYPNEILLITYPVQP